MNMMTNVFEKLIDFTRTSAGGYYGPDGLYRMMPTSKNLLTYTQEFDNAAWVKTRAAAYPFDPAMATLGPELVTNGTFDTDSSWTKGAGWSIAGGLLVATGVTGNDSSSQTINTGAGKWFACTFTVVSITAGVGVSFGLGASLGEQRTAPGTYTEYFQGTAAQNGIGVYQRGGIALTCEVDNVSVKEVIGGLITAPDGTLTADALVATEGASLHRVLGNGAVAGSLQAFSFYAKAGTHRYLQVSSGANAQLYANFDLLTGTVGNVGTIATAFIESVGNGWYRCGFIGTPATITGMHATLITSATAAFDESWTATGTESIYLWGAQVEVGSTATSYARNFGGLFPPRFDYDPVTKAPRGLLVEEQRTNLLLRSEEFENVAWAKSNSSVTANAAVSPDGSADADTLAAAGANGTVTQAVSTTAIAMTFSIHLKRKTGTGNIQITADGSTWVTQTIDSTNWTRCIVTQTALAGTTSPGIRIVASGDEVFAWGAQYE